MRIYEKLLDLKYRKGISTCDLLHRFPNQIERVNEVALLDISRKDLREMIPEKDILDRLMSLKRRLTKNV